MLGLKLNHVSKRGHGSPCPEMLKITLKGLHPLFISWSHTFYSDRYPKNVSWHMRFCLSCTTLELVYTNNWSLSKESRLIWRLITISFMYVPRVVYQNKSAILLLHISTLGQVINEIQGGIHDPQGISFPIFLSKSPAMYVIYGDQKAINDVRLRDDTTFNAALIS